MKIEIDGIMLSDCSKPPEDWDVTIDGEKHKVVRYSLGAFRKIRIDVEPMKTFVERNMVSAGICVGVGSVESDSGTWWTRATKEEKKMLNVDKYRKDILKLKEDKTNKLDCAIQTIRTGLGDGKKCPDGMRCVPCVGDTIDWLFSEHEPTLLENGDDLKPGDWIMVRNYKADNWKKRPFMCFYKNRFFVADYGEDLRDVGSFSHFGQARLLEDGE